MTVEVLEIRENKDSKSKHTAKGRLDILIKGTGIEVRNIQYTIRNDGRVLVNFRHKGKRSIYFQEKTIEDSVHETINNVLLEHHKNDLPKLEDSNNKPS